MTTSGHVFSTAVTAPKSEVKEKEMTVTGRLAKYAGSWSGTSTLQDEHPRGIPRAESLSTATVTSILGGNFLRIDYTWSYDGKPEEGSLLLGGFPQEGGVTVHWIDTWHNGNVVMACRGGMTSDGGISVYGSYAAPPGPDWGWRIDVLPEGSEKWRLVMYNISPEGVEGPAVDATYTRS
jgi:hypothetical protein